MTEKEAIEKYNNYLEGHIGNVNEALDLFHDLKIPFVLDNYDELKNICSKHDASKYEDIEYEPYRKHFYPINDNEKLESEAFEIACRHHIKNNKHHWDYWINEDGELEIPDEHEYKLYCVERCADWLSMANQHGEKPTDWYNANKDAMIMPDYGFSLCEEILNSVPDDFELSFKGVRGNLDEGYTYAKDVTTKDLDRNHVMFITYGSDGEHIVDFDNVTRLFEYIKQCGGFSSFKGITWSIKSDYKDGEFYLVRDRYHKGGWKWEDVNGDIVDAYDYKTFSIRPELKGAIKNMNSTEDGKFRIDLNDNWYTTSGDNYIIGHDKNDAILKLNYDVYNSLDESSDYWKSLEPKIEDTENDRKGVDMYKERISNGYHRPILVNKAGEILDGNHTMTAYQELGIEPKLLYRGERGDFYKAVAETKGDAEKAISVMINNGTATLIEAAGPSREYLKKNFKNVKFNSNFSSAEIITESSNTKKNDFDINQFHKMNDVFNVERAHRGYIVEANMSQLKRNTLTQDPTRAKKSKHVQSKYIGISKYGVLNFMTSSETHSGVNWYQEVQFPSFNGFMNIVEQGDTIDANDVQKAMKSDNIKISCDDPSFLYWAWKYKAWRDLYGLERETRAPKRNNTRLKGALCFTGDTEVLTSEGFKKIKDINIGDYVFSHTGKLNKVTDIGSREAEIWNVYIDKYKIETTKEHPFLIDGNSWVEVKDLKVNDKTTSPILRLDESINLPKDYAFMLGLYLSDGTARLKYYNQPVNHSKYKIIDNTKVFKGIDIAIDKRFSEVYNDILSKTSFEYDISENSETNNGYIHILGTNDTNLDLINFICENGGLNHLDKYTKFISEDILQWSNKDKLDFIAGFFLGDGSFSLSGTDSLRLNICNSNKQIIDMIFILLSSVTKNVRYNVSNISGETLEIAGNEVHRKKDLYLLTVTNKFVEEFVERYPYMTRVKFKTLNNEWNYNYRKRIDSEEDYYLRPIKNIEHSCEIDTVYNISVENDDSYLVTKGLISVHNCKHLYSVIELLNEKRIIDLIARDLNEWCKKQLGIENTGYQDAEGMIKKDFKANQYDYNIEDVLKSLLSRENFRKYQDGTPLEDLGLSDKEMKDIDDAIKNMRDRSQFALKSELEKQFEPAKRGRKIKRDDIKLSVGNEENEEEK